MSAASASSPMSLATPSPMAVDTPSPSAAPTPVPVANLTITIPRTPPHASAIPVGAPTEVQTPFSIFTRRGAIRVDYPRLDIGSFNIHDFQAKLVNATKYQAVLHVITSECKKIGLKSDAHMAFEYRCCKDSKSAIQLLIERIDVLLAATHTNFSDVLIPKAVAALKYYLDACAQKGCKPTLDLARETLCEFIDQTTL